MVKLEEAKRKHIQLQRTLVEVMAKVEEAAIQNGQARRDYQKEATLDSQYSDLQNRLNVPSQFTSRVHELTYVLKSLLQRLEGSGPRSGTGFGAEKFDSAAQQQALHVLDQQ